MVSGQIPTLTNLATRIEEPEGLAAASSLVARKTTKLPIATIPKVATSPIAATLVTVVMVVVVTVVTTFLSFPHSLYYGVNHKKTLLSIAILEFDDKFVKIFA